MKKRIWAVIAVLCALLAIVVSGCNKSEKPESGQQSQTSSPIETEADTKASDEVIVKGEGNTTFDFTVVDVDGTETKFEIHTDKTTVGEALQELGLIDGEEGQYGLYVKSVNSVTYDYDKDGKYWAFYIDGEYASSGADTTEIVPGSVYSFKAE